MTPSIKNIEELLEQGRITLHELLSIRSELDVKFKLHPLGFIACLLLNEGERKLRLHYWPTNGGIQQSLDCQIHDHLFDFKSWVLAGAVENIEYVTSTAGVEYAIYQTHYEANRSILTKTPGRAMLIEKNRSTFPSGSSYSVQAGAFHETVRVGKSPSFTVLITTDVSPSAPLVFGPTNGLDSYIYERDELPEEVIAKMLLSNFSNSHLKP